MLVCIVILCALGLAELSHAAAYKLARIVDNGSPAPVGTGFKIFGATLSGPTVAFYAAYGGQGASGAFTTTGGPLTTIAKSGDQAPIGTFLSDQFAINAASIGDGVTAFTGSYGTGINRQGRGVFSGSGGATTTIAKTGDPAPVGMFSDFPGSPATSSGFVAFLGEYTSGEGIFVGNGGALTTIAKKGDGSVIGALTSFSDPMISGGLIAFQARSATGAGIFTSSGGVVTPLITTATATPFGMFTNVSSPLVSGDTVAFVGSYLGGNGIFATDGLTLQTIAKSGDPAPEGTFGSIFQPSFSHGKVAFVAEDALGRGIFLKSGGSTAAVIRVGNPLFGSTVSQIFFGLTLDATGSGNIAFTYRLANGRLGIALASPIPEPGAACLTMLACASAALLRRPVAVRFASQLNHL